MTGRANRIHARARRRLRRVGLTSKMSSRTRRGNGRSPSWVAAVASVSAGAHQPEGARRGGKEAAEVACEDRDKGASEDQAPEEDLARQVDSRGGPSAAKRSRRACRCSNTPRQPRTGRAWCARSSLYRSSLTLDARARVSRELHRRQPCQDSRRLSASPAHQPDDARP